MTGRPPPKPPPRAAAAPPQPVAIGMPARPGNVGSSATASVITSAPAEGAASAAAAPASAVVTSASASVTHGGGQKVCPTCMGRYPADFKVCPRDATPLEAAGEDLDPLLGTVLADAFQIVRCVGEGGMARVYEARHVRLPNKRFAVKVLLPQHAKNADIVQRFQREAQAASGIGHPNVVDVYDVHRTPDGVPYMVCEYLEGNDFSSVLDKRGKIDVLLAIAVARQVCKALSAAHAKGIVHRDMKPENVFLVGDPAMPIVKVIDFGISKIDNSGGASLTRTGMIMGTPGYMPPEQARGARVDHRADVYGVGAMLYRALTGKLPFDADDAVEALSLVLTHDPPRPRSIDSTIPPALELVIERAMAKDPEDRYASLDDLDAELEPFSAEARATSMLPPEPRGTHDAGPVNPIGATMLSPGPAKTGTPHKTSIAMERATREAKWARPNIVLLSLVAYVWLVAIVVDALASAVQAGKGAELANSSTETLLVVLGVVALSLTPLVFWVRYLYRGVWGNSVRSVEVAGWLKRVTIASMLGYSVCAMLLRLLDTTVLPALNPGAPLFSPLLLAISIGSAGATYLGARARRRR